ncbi:MAG: type II secretion system F family protein [Polyangiaceae bacterium]
MSFPVPTLSACKLGANIALGLTLAIVVWSALRDSEGPARRAWLRYTDYLDRKLRRLFSRHNGTRVALGQVAAAILLAAVALPTELPFWWAPPLLALLLPALYLENLQRRRVLQIEAQLDAFIVALANALKAIPSVAAAFQSVVETSNSPIKEEIELCVREMRVGSTLDEALLHMAARVGSARLDSALSAVVMGRQIGGNLTRVLESTASSIREMSRLEGVLRAKTSEAKMQLYVIGAAPLVLMVSLTSLSPGYFEPLQHGGLGGLLGLAAIGCWLLALYLAKQVLSVSL